jgi:hypothetical protein
MYTGFLRRYFERLDSLPGWFLPDAAVMFMAYNQLASQRVAPLHTLEIGVFHGKSAIAVASLRGDSGTFTAIDVFNDLSSRDGSPHDVGIKGSFLANMAEWLPTPERLRTIVAPSATVSAEALGPHSFCHIDGLHSAEGTYSDMKLCAEVVVPGGLVALDDYFNQRFPGVSEGALLFEQKHPGVLTPVAVGFNKVLFQRTDVSDLNHRFAREFDYIPAHVATMWGRPVALFESPIAPCIDLDRSTPHQLVPRPESRLLMRATIEPATVAVNARRGQALTIPVRIVNQATVDFDWAIGLSYHLFSSDGELVKWDNPRSQFYPPLRPGAECEVSLGVVAPETAGAYTLELDMVWEGIAWFKDKGNSTRTVALSVS